MVLSSFQRNNTLITLLPNRSASWAQTRRFLYVLCSTMLAIGMLWTFRGAWLVLPYSSVQAVLVAYVFYRVCRATYQCQEITCSGEQIIVQFGSHLPQRSWVLERARTGLLVTAATHHLEGPRLTIFDDNHSIELGHFLNRVDKEAALREFKKAGLPVHGFNHEGSRLL